MDDSIALETEQLIVSLRAKVNLLETQLKDKETASRLETDNLRSQLSSSQTETENKSIEIYELKTTCAELKTEKELYLSDQRIREIQWKEKLKSKERELIELQDRPNTPLNLPLDAHSQVSFLTKRVQDLRYKYAKETALAQEFKEQLRRLVAEIEAKSPELLQHKQRFADLSWVYTALKSQAIDLVTTEATQTQLISELRDELAQNLIEKETVKKDCEELAAQVQTLLYEVDLLQSNKDIRKPTSFLDIQEMQRENVNLKRTLRQVKALGSAELLLQAKAEAMEKQFKIESLERQIEAIQASEPQVQLDNEETRENVRKVTMDCFECANLSQKCGNLQTELNSKKMMEASMQTGLREFQETISQLRIDKFVLESKVSNSATETASLNSQLEAAVELERRLQCDNRNLRLELDALLSSHQRTSRLLKDLEATHVTYMQHSTEEKDELDTKIQALEREVKRLKSELINVGVEANSDIENLRLEVSSLRSQLVTSTPVLELHAAKTEIARLKSTLNSMAETQQNLLKTNTAKSTETLILEATNSQATFSRLRERLAMAISDSESRAAETLILNTELQDLKLQLQFSQTRVFDLEIALRKGQEDAFQRIEELKAQSEVEREEMASEQVTKEAEFRVLQDENSILRAELHTVAEGKSVLEQKLAQEKLARETAETSLHSEARNSPCTKAALSKMMGVLLRHQKIT